MFMFKARSLSKCSMRVLALVLLLIAVSVFFLAFYCLAPFIISTIPAGTYHSFISAMIYVIIGWCGGVGIPAVLAISAIGLIIVSFLAD